VTTFLTYRSSAPPDGSTAFRRLERTSQASASGRTQVRGQPRHASHLVASHWPIAPRPRPQPSDLTTCTNGRRRTHPPHAQRVQSEPTPSTACPKRAARSPGPERVREAAKKMARRAAALLLAVAFAAAVLGPAAAGQKKPATAARREDIPYIKCQVCERIAREISAQVANKQQELPPSKKVLRRFFFLPSALNSTGSRAV
jgi:hypothetical protein